MGKGDKKTKRGKLFQGSYGIRRPKKSVKKTSVNPLPVKTAEVKDAVKEVKDTKEVKDIREVKEAKAPRQPKAEAPVKAAAKPAAVKKEVKPKKEEAE
jgi:30S ribosomal protein S31